MPRTRASTTPVKQKPAATKKKVESPYFQKARAGKKRVSTGSSTRPGKRSKRAQSEDEESEPLSETESDDDDEGEDDYKDSAEEDEEDEEDKDTALSDALDDSDFDEKAARRKVKKPSAATTPRGKKMNGQVKASPVKLSPSKGRKSGGLEGLEVVGEVVEAPTTGRVPPGQLSQNTLDFLEHMKDPKCNDREWFRLHEPVYRLAEQEWKDFIERLLEAVSEVDDEVPPLPPKDVIHRIYRDIRFSNDKTPYKRGFSATFSRSGRKGIFAKYHIHIQPGGNSMLACGVWCPNKNELESIRHHIKHDPSRLREIISSKAFTKHFGPAKPDPKGRRQNVFGREDELKTAPKGVEKTHKDIDLLKLRSVAVHKMFSDKEVLDKKFIEHICEVVAEMRPFVHCLNDYLTVPVSEDEADDE